MWKLVHHGISNKPIIFAAVVLCLVSHAAQAERIRAFVPGRAFEVSMDLKDFEPDSVLQPKTILGGSTKDGVIITIIMEKEKPGTTPEQVRARYGGPAGPEREEATIQTINAGEMRAVFEPWPGEMKREKINGYLVKDDLSFDIHLTVDIVAYDKEDITEILAKFHIIDSDESRDTQSLLEQLKSVENTASGEALLGDFIKKYPSSSYASAMLGELRFRTRKYEAAKQAYDQALRNHKTQPITNPGMLWGCYDGLGMCCGMAGEYEDSKRYIELGYKLAEELEHEELIAASAYNLACWYAETNNAVKSVEFLEKAIQSNPAKKENAKKDPSFKRLQGDEAFKALVGG